MYFEALHPPGAPSPISSFLTLPPPCCSLGPSHTKKPSTFLLQGLCTCPSLSPESLSLDTHRACYRTQSSPASHGACAAMPALTTLHKHAALAHHPRPQPCSNSLHNTHHLLIHVTIYLCILSPVRHFSWEFKLIEDLEFSA